MPEVTIHSLGSERKATVIVNGVKKEFTCDVKTEISEDYIEALKNSRFNVTEHDSAPGSAEAGEDENSSPAQQTEVLDGENDGDGEKDPKTEGGEDGEQKPPVVVETPKVEAPKKAPAKRAPKKTKAA